MSGGVHFAVKGYQGRCVEDNAIKKIALGVVKNMHEY